MTWKTILKSFDEQLKQGIKELDMNEFFDIEFVGKYDGNAYSEFFYKEERIYTFNISFDTSEYFTIDQSKTIREGKAGEKYGPYTMFITIKPHREGHTKMEVKLKLAVVKPKFYGIAHSLESLFKEIDDMLVDYYGYLRTIYLK
jgi:hypothetical protein